MLVDTLQIDTLSIVPGSVMVWNTDTLVSKELWQMEYHSARFIIRPELRRQPLIVQYTCMPLYLGKTYAHKNPVLIAAKKDAPYRPFVIGGGGPARSPLGDESIRKSGSISRGIMIGNNQNLAVNSTLNLQLSGKITDRYELLASISDDNIPIQPDGNTSQLQDFDQVFIQISDAKSKLIAGDFVLNRPYGHYLQYQKRTQGLYFAQQIKHDKRGTLKIESSASVSKGRFGRNVMQGIEGNQGPYRLTGADGEQFIIILSGTEQVYIDGKLLQRGLDKDYVIDYNAAEISFTPRHLITKDRRITVEFQYSEKRYARPLLQTALTWTTDHHKTFFNVYSESDARNQPLQQDLSDADKLQLAQAGDDPSAAVTSGIAETSFTNSQVLYAQIDSLGYASILLYSTDSITARFRVVFSFVGQGKGDYVEDGFAATGKKYKWIMPEMNGEELVHQGNYAPVALLVAPKKNQMISAGHEIQTQRTRGNRTTGHQFKTEGALSNKDVNTFSAIGNEDNVGFATKNWYQYSLQRADSSTTTPQLKTFKWTAAYEYNHRHFTGIERFREVEFNRNWNFGAQQPAGTLHWAQTEVAWSRSQNGQLAIGGQWLQIDQWGQGLKGQLQTTWRNRHGFQAQVQGSALSTQGNLQSQFVRHTSNISQTIKGMRLYYRDEHEKNQFYLAQSDSLSNQSYQFYDWELGVGTADTLKKNVTLYYRNRFENRLDENQLSRASIADQYGITARWNVRPESRLALFVSNRRLRINNPEAISTLPENTLVTRVEYNWKLKNNFIQSNTFYETGSGLEQRKEYIYIEVQPGQGNFVWVDYNANGVKDLNEFESALYAYEANYIRSSIQSNEYLRTYTNQINQSFTIQPERLIKQQKGWRKTVARLSAQTTIRIERKNTSSDANDRFNPLQYDANDTSLLSLNGLMRHVIFINKSNPIFNAECIYQANNGKNLLSNGFETRGDQFWQAALRWTLKRTWTISTDVKKGNKTAASDYLNGRNYALDYLQIQPILSWQPGNTGRLNVKTLYTEKTNTLGMEHAIIQKIGLEGVLSDVKKGTLQCELNYYKIAYNGESNNSLTFDMLEGLNTGNNITWSLTVQRTVAKNLQLNLNYNGRKPETVPTIHAGGLQLRAFF